MIYSAKAHLQLKQCFQRKTMSLQLQIESATTLTKIIISSLLYHNDTIHVYKEWLKSINYFKGEHTNNFGQNLKLQSAVMALNIRSM